MLQGKEITIEVMRLTMWCLFRLIRSGSNR